MLKSIKISKRSKGEGENIDKELLKHLELIAYLMNENDEHRKTVMDYAKQNKYIKVVEYLEEKYLEIFNKTEPNFEYLEEEKQEILKDITTEKYPFQDNSKPVFSSQNDFKRSLLVPCNLRFIMSAVVA